MLLGDLIGAVNQQTQRHKATFDGSFLSHLSIFMRLEFQQWKMQKLGDRGRNESVLVSCFFLGSSEYHRLNHQPANCRECAFIRRRQKNINKMIYHLQEIKFIVNHVELDSLSSTHMR